MGKWDSSSEDDEKDDTKAVAVKKRKTDETGTAIVASVAIVGGSEENPTVSPKTSLSPKTQEGSLLIESSSSTTSIEDGEVTGEQLQRTASSSSMVVVASSNGIHTDDGVEEEKEKEKKEEEEEDEYNPLFYGCRSVDEYIRLNFIDQGTYGLVFKARCRATGRIYALKQVKIGRESAKVGFPVTALRETNILLALRHPNVVRVREMVVGTNIDKVYMVMDYGGYDLKICMDMAKKPFSAAEVKQLMVQFLSGVDHMHQNWYVHRDLKTSNLLYQNGTLRICDFGLARKYGSPIAPYTYEVVTLWYRAPELLFGSRIYSTPLDMWSLGCIFVEMLTSQPLFPGEGELDQIAKVLKMLGIPTEEMWPGVTTLPNAAKINWKQYSSRYVDFVCL